MNMNKISHPSIYKKNRRGRGSMLLKLVSLYRRENNLLSEKHEIIKIEYTKLEASQVFLTKSLNENEILLKEIHHRVKNNFQLVISLLNIQARENNYSNMPDFLDKVQSRIASMALIHQNLYQAEHPDKVVFKEYLENLVENVKSSFGDMQNRVSVAVIADDVCYDIQISIPLGLIINELLCNSLKHAFPKNTKGYVFIGMKQLNENDFELLVRDNGSGIKINQDAGKSFGFELVRLLVDQIGGAMVISYCSGTVCRINFSRQPL